MSKTWTGTRNWVSRRFKVSAVAYCLATLLLLAQVGAAKAQSDDLEQCIIDAASLFNTYKECVSQVISYHAAKVTKPDVIISFAKRQCGIERQKYFKRLSGCMGRDVAQSMFDAEEAGNLQPHLLKLIENAGKQKIHGDLSPPDPGDPFHAPMTFKVVSDASGAVTIIAATGAITEETPLMLKSFVSSALRVGRQAIVRLDSPGGLVAPALKLGRLIRRWSFSTEVIKTADRRAECLSACVYAFIGGVQRSADVGHLGIHRFYEQLAIDDPSRKAYDSRDLARVQELTGELVKYVSEMGVDAELVSRASSVAENTISHLTGQELKNWRVVNHSQNQ